jgi:hypothetical protein
MRKLLTVGRFRAPGRCLRGIGPGSLHDAQRQRTCRPRYGLSGSCGPGHGGAGAGVRMSRRLELVRRWIRLRPWLGVRAVLELCLSGQARPVLHLRPDLWDSDHRLLGRSILGPVLSREAMVRTARLLGASFAGAHHAGGTAAASLQGRMGRPALSDQSSQPPYQGNRESGRDNRFPRTGRSRPRRRSRRTRSPRRPAGATQPNRQSQDVRRANPRAAGARRQQANAPQEMRRASPTQQNAPAAEGSKGHGGQHDAGKEDKR